MVFLYRKPTCTETLRAYNITKLSVRNLYRKLGKWQPDWFYNIQQGETAFYQIKDNFMVYNPIHAAYSLGRS